MSTLMEKIEVVGAVAVLGTLCGGTIYVSTLRADVTNLESEVRSLNVTDTAKRITYLEDQLRSLDPPSTSKQITQLNDQVRSLEPSTTLTRISQLENQVHSLEVSLGSMTSTLVDLERRSASPPTNPIFTKCSKLADEADTGMRLNSDGFYVSFDAKSEVIKNALAAMQQLGCSSLPR